MKRMVKSCLGAGECLDTSGWEVWDEALVSGASESAKAHDCTSNSLPLLLGTLVTYLNRHKE
jgi:hypothetical protein